MHLVAYKMIDQHAIIRWLLVPLTLCALLSALHAAGATQTPLTSTLRYSSYVGGDNTDSVKDVAVDAREQSLCDRPDLF